MRFSAKEDIEVPIAFVYEQMTDFPAIERSAQRRGAEVQRIDTLSEPGPGMLWDVKFTYRGRPRAMKLELTELDRPDRMVITSRSPTMGGQMVVDLIALSKERTRINVDMQLKPQSLATRLLVQSLKLMRSSLNTRYRGRLKAYGQELEDRYSDA